MLSKMTRAAWSQNLLLSLERFGEEGQNAASFLRKRKTYIGFWKARKNVGAFWTPLKTIHLNTVYYSLATNPADPNLLTILIHEIKHLQQGIVTALSVYGELEAWQLQFRLYHQKTNVKMHPAIEKLLSLPFGWDREVLMQARTLMQDFAGKGYRVDLLPLYPLGKEIRFRLFGKQP
ncbi:MAG: hypothetical protein QY302_15245 [Anaerolineales bacterium]|nr:MAG: hypothetical protein QY302_15245 [Anaerolineales bacterium]